MQIVTKATAAITRAKNYFFSPAVISAQVDNIKKKTATDKNLSGYIFPAQLARLRFDILMWRDAIREAEQAYYPHRVKMQQMYNDVILNGHTDACWSRRKDLTLLRDFEILNSSGEDLDDVKELLQKPWFSYFVGYTLDAIAFGYSLIALGDVVADSFPDLQVIRRWNVSPDRHNVTAFIYAIGGVDFLADEEVKKWHVWVPTNNDIGVSTCGNGLLYKVALPSIYLRNNMGNNADYAENYGQPIRKGTTTKTEEAERAEFARALASMGSDAWILLDPTDEVELVESKSTGQGFKVYESIEERCERAIARIILGHADALDSVPGKLGGTDGEKSPAYMAMRDKQTKDGAYVEAVINHELLPRLREIGFNIPDDAVFKYKNDHEKEEFREREDRSNQATATIAKTMKDAGLKMDPAYFEERTGIPTTEAEPPEPKDPPAAGIERVINKLKLLYGDQKKAD